VVDFRAAQAELQVRKEFLGRLLHPYAAAVDNQELASIRDDQTRNGGTHGLMVI